MPYSQDFSSISASSAVHPSEWHGWNLRSVSSASTYATVIPIADFSLFTSNAANTTTGGVHNYNGKIGIFLNSNNSYTFLCLAINTTSKSIIQVSYNIMNMWNPYTGSSDTRFNKVSF